MVQRKLEKDGNCDALQLEDRTTSRQSFWLFGQICTAHAHRSLCYFQAPDQNSDLTLPLTSATVISYIVQIFWQSVGI